MTVGSIFAVGFMLLFVGAIACLSLYAILTERQQNRRVGVI